VTRNDRALATPYYLANVSVILASEMAPCVNQSQLLKNGRDYIFFSFFSDTRHEKKGWIRLHAGEAITRIKPKQGKKQLLFDITINILEFLYEVHACQGVGHMKYS
jgi:hypothetical protein